MHTCRCNPLSVIKYTTTLSMVILSYSAFSSESPSIGNQQIFPADNPWHWDISGHDVHPNSSAYINSIGASTGLHPDFGTEWDGAPMGIPYVVVSGADNKTDVSFSLDGEEDDAYGGESDPGPYRIPIDAPVEGGLSSDGDRHVIAVDTSADTLYELYHSFPRTGFWEAMSGAVYDLSSNDHHPDGWTSADAAGLPIFPGLVRYEEAVVNGEIDHAIRLTVSRSQNAYIYPARHYASSSSDKDLPPMGLRLRLKADFDISGFDPVCQVILRAMKKHGLIVADNGSNWYISGAPDDRWNDEVLSELKSVDGSNFEAVLTVDSNGDPILPLSARYNRRISSPAELRSWQAFGHETIYDIRGRSIAGMNILENSRCVTGIYIVRSGPEVRAIVDIE